MRRKNMGHNHIACGCAYTIKPQATCRTSVLLSLWPKVVNGCTLLRPAIWWSHELGFLSVSGPPLCSYLRHGTNYLHVCDRWTQHYKCFGTSWRRTCSSSNCGDSLAALTAAVAVSVSVAPHTELWLTYLLYIHWKAKHSIYCCAFCVQGLETTCTVRIV